MVLTSKEVGGLIKKARKEKSRKDGKKYTQIMLAEDIGISRSYLGDIETGRTYPNYKLLSKIADVCDVPLDFFSDIEKAVDENIAKQLAGYPPEIHDAVKKALRQYDMKIDFLSGMDKDKIHALGYEDNNAFVKEMTAHIHGHNSSRIPVVGVIRAGEPILAQQNIIDYEYIPEVLAKSGDYFGLKVVGDSMNLSRINDGDIVIVRQQPTVENGEVAVVIVDKENATVKKFYRNNSMITLLPNSTNIKYQPRVFDQTKTEVKVLGKVVKVIINL